MPSDFGNEIEGVTTNGYGLSFYMPMNRIHDTCNSYMEAPDGHCMVDEIVYSIW